MAAHGIQLSWLASTPSPRADDPKARMGFAPQASQPPSRTFSLRGGCLRLPLPCTRFFRSGRFTWRSPCTVFSRSFDSRILDAGRLPISGLWERTLLATVKGFGHPVVGGFPWARHSDLCACGWDAAATPLAELPLRCSRRQSTARRTWRSGWPAADGVFYGDFWATCLVRRGSSARPAVSTPEARGGLAWRSGERVSTNSWARVCPKATLWSPLAERGGLLEKLIRGHRGR